MPILPHNQRAIDALKPTPDRVLHRSEIVTGLVLEVMPSGKKKLRVVTRILRRPPSRRAARSKLFLSIG
jgi:hypothetical protein